MQPAQACGLGARAELRTRLRLKLLMLPQRSLLLCALLSCLSPGLEFHASALTRSPSAFCAFTAPLSPSALQPLSCASSAAPFSRLPAPALTQRSASASLRSSFSGARIGGSSWRGLELLRVQSDQLEQQRLVDFRGRSRSLRGPRGLNTKARDDQETEDVAVKVAPEEANATTARVNWVTGARNGTVRIWNGVTTSAGNLTRGAANLTRGVGNWTSRATGNFSVGVGSWTGGVSNWTTGAFSSISGSLLGALPAAQMPAELPAIPDLKIRSSISAVSNWSRVELRPGVSFVGRLNYNGTGLRSAIGGAGLNVQPLQYAGELWSSAANWTSTRRQRRERIVVRSSKELEEALKDNVSIFQMDIRGRSQPWRQNDLGELVEAMQADLSQSPRGDGRMKQLQHPVLRAIWNRKREGSLPGQRQDGYKIALAIEGGGLRGSVTAGMASALIHLGLMDSFDMVLGSSAGSIIGTYMVGRGTPNITYQFFCNHLTTSREKLNGSSWLDLGRLVDLFAPEGTPIKQKSVGPPMLLEYPMKTIMQELLPVDWATFAKNDKVQPLKVVAAGLFSERPVVLGSEEGSFTDLQSLCECVKASCMLPGVAGVQPPWLKGSSAQTPELLREGQRQWLEQEFKQTFWAKAKNAFEEQVRIKRNAERKKAAQRGKKKRPGTRDGIPFASTFQRRTSEGIGRTELQAALGQLGVTPSEEELDSILDMADLDQNGLIDFQEFRNMIFSMLAQGGLEGWMEEGKGDVPTMEPMVDALVFEPIPYRSAIEYGCTHVLVLRSYPDGRLLPKSLLGLFERLVAPRCLDPYPNVKEHLQSNGHSVVYAEDILRLNEEVAPNRDDLDNVQVEDARDVGRSLAGQMASWSGMREEPEMLPPQDNIPHLLSIAPLDIDGEALSALELNRDALLRGIMQGFARAYDLVVTDDEGNNTATGAQVATDVYLPIHYKFLQELAVTGAPKDKAGLTTGTQVFTPPGDNPGWFMEFYRERSRISIPDWPIGLDIPEHWTEGVHFDLDMTAADFARNELVVLDTQQFGVVIGSNAEDVIVQVDEMTLDKNGGGFPYRFVGNSE